MEWNIKEGGIPFLSAMTNIRINIVKREKEKRILGGILFFPESDWRCFIFYLFTWKRVLPVAKKSLIWLAAAMPALMLASAV